MKNRLVALAKKTAVATFLAGVLVALVPSIASASTESATPSQAPGISVTDPGAMPKSMDKSVTEKDTVAPSAVFDCLYSQGVSDIYFDCIVYAGAIQFVIFCSDSNTYFSPWFPGPAQWFIYGNCGPGVALTAWGLIQQ